MSKSRVGIFAALAISVAAPAMGQATQTGTPKTGEVEAEKPKKVCRSVQVTGHRVPKRECKTAADWSGETVRDSNEDVRFKTSGAVGG
jgi:hypothetical protein